MFLIMKSLPSSARGTISSMTRKISSMRRRGLSLIFYEKALADSAEAKKSIEETETRTGRRVNVSLKSYI